MEKAAVTIVIIFFLMMIASIVWLIYKVRDLETEIKILEFANERRQSESLMIDAHTKDIIIMHYDIKTIKEKLDK